MEERVSPMTDAVAEMERSGRSCLQVLPQSLQEATTMIDYIPASMFWHWRGMS